MLSGLSKLITDTPQFGRLVEQLQSGQREALSIFPPARALLLGALWQPLEVPVLVVAPRPDDARRLYDQLLVYWGEKAPIHHFVELEALPFERLTVDTVTTHQRLRALAALAGFYPHERPPLVVASASGLAVKTLRPEMFQVKESYTVLRRGDKVSLAPLLARH